MKAKKFDVLLLFQLSFVIIGLLMSIYIGMTENYNLQPVMLIVLSIMLMIMGLRQYKRTQSLLAFIIILCISLYIIYSAVMGIVLRSNSSLPTAPPWYVILQSV